ncbi:MAG: hypothetical protein H7257_08770 [Taibaiella sp.]|nr:hypothetical protein [Taibaiella sp.]
MNSFSIDVRLEGNKFYPSKLQSNVAVPLTILSEYGKIANKGRYAGKESPFGMAVFQYPVSGKDINESLYDCYVKLLSWKKILDECGVEDVIIDIGNDEDYPLAVTFSKELMNAFNSLNATIEFHTVSKEKNAEKMRDGYLIEILKKNPSVTKEKLQKLINLSQMHPSLSKVNALSYWLFLGLKNSSFEQDAENHLNEFDFFCDNLVV